MDEFFYSRKKRILKDFVRKWKISFLSFPYDSEKKSFKKLFKSELSIRVPKKLILEFNFK